MRILWVPHNPWNKARTRDQYFIEELKGRHEFHVITWTQPSSNSIHGMLNPALHYSGLRKWTTKKDGVTFHHLRRFQTTSFTKALLRRNESSFQKAIRQIIYEEDIDIAIFACSHHLNGLPPFDIGIPIVFDYLDYIYDVNVRNAFLKNSDCVLCVSQELQKQALEFNDNSYYLPNGAKIPAVRSGNAERAREMLGIGNAPLVSLIGITTSKRAYFIDSYRIVRSKLKEAKLLIVGEGPELNNIRERARGLGDDVIITGWIPQQMVYDCFMATDVGLNPVDIDSYFDAQCPIKVIEFAAANKPVVSARVKELENLGLSNVVLTNDEPIDFCRGILESMNRTFPPPDLEPFDIEKLALDLERILQAL